MKTNLPNQNEFNISVSASVLSTLSRAEIERRIVLALWDEGSDETAPDGQTDELEVVDYKFTIAEENNDRGTDRIN